MAWRYKSWFCPVSCSRSIVWTPNTVGVTSRSMGRSCTLQGIVTSCSLGSYPGGFFLLVCGFRDSSWSSEIGAVWLKYQCQWGYRSSTRPSRQLTCHIVLSIRDPRRRQWLRGTGWLKITEDVLERLITIFLGFLNLSSLHTWGFL